MSSKRWIKKSMPTALVQIDHLCKEYHENGPVPTTIQVLQDVSMDIYKGEIIAILGLNGAGKSTLIKILLGLVYKSGGNIRLFGKPIEHSPWKNMVGYLPEVFRISPYTSARSFLDYMGALSGLHGNRLKERIGEVLRIVHLEDAASLSTIKYSKGMSLRLGIAQAILHEPTLLFLDEPTDGLDVFGKIMVRNLILKLSSHGTTIVINSHFLSELEMVAQRVVILHKGKLIQCGTLQELLLSDSKFSIELPFSVQLPFPWLCKLVNRKWICEARTTSELQSLLIYLREKGIQPITVSPEKSTLEDAFIQSVKML